MPLESKIAHFQESLTELYDRKWLTKVKLGTEVENLFYEEIDALKEMIPSFIPISLKISGCEDTQGVFFGIKNHLDTLIVPMVESAYALKKFIDTVDMTHSYLGGEIYLCLQIETKTALSELDAILTSPYFHRIHSLAIGRSDLSKSLGLDIESSIFRQLLRELVDSLSQTGLPLVIGGNISLSPESFSSLTHTEQISIHTRFFENTYDALCLSWAENISSFLDLEIEMLEILQLQFPHLAKKHNPRIQEIKRRKEAK